MSTVAGWNAEPSPAYEVDATSVVDVGEAADVMSVWVDEVDTCEPGDGLDVTELGTDDHGVINLEDSTVEMIGANASDDGSRAHAAAMMSLWSEDLVCVPGDGQDVTESSPDVELPENAEYPSQSAEQQQSATLEQWRRQRDRQNYRTICEEAYDGAPPSMDYCESQADDFVGSGEHHTGVNGHPVNASMPDESDGAFAASTGRRRATARECGRDYRQGYTSCVTRRLEDDAEICGPDVVDPHGGYQGGSFIPKVKRPTLRVQGGRQVDCRDYRRYGENPTTNSRTRHQSEADTRTNTSSTETSGKATLTTPTIPGMPSMEGSASYTEGHDEAQSNTRGSGVSETQTVSIDAHQGWQQECLIEAEEAYDACRDER